MGLERNAWTIQCDHPICAETTDPAVTTAHAALLWRQAGGAHQPGGMLWPVMGRAEPVALPELYTCAGHTPAWDAPRPAWMVKAGR